MMIKGYEDEEIWRAQKYKMGRQAALQQFTRARSQHGTCGHVHHVASHEMEWKEKHTNAHLLHLHYLFGFLGVCFSHSQPTLFIPSSFFVFIFKKNIFFAFIIQRMPKFPTPTKAIFSNFDFKVSLFLSFFSLFFPLFLFFPQEWNFLKQNQIKVFFFIVLLCSFFFFSFLCFAFCSVCF